MAEVLGLIASSVAVTQLASAILTSAIKIKQLFDEVKDVPETIIYLMDHIDTLASVLLAAEDEHRDATYCNIISSGGKSVQKSLQVCQKALDHMASLSKDLEGKIRSSHPLKRRIGKVKVVLKKDILVKYERRLDLSLQLLSLSQQTYMIGLQRAQPDIIISRLSAMSHSAIPTPQLDQSDGNNRNILISRSMTRRSLLATTTSNLDYIDSDASESTITLTKITPTGTQYFSGSSASYSSSWRYANRKNTFKLGLASITGLIEIDTLQYPKVLNVPGDSQGKNSLAVTSSASCKFTPRFKARLHIPRWLSQKVWECATLQSTWGWTYHFRTYNIIDYVEGFRLVYGKHQTYQQKVENIQNAFKNGQISIYDQFDNGWTLLHFCAIVEPQMCLFLLAQGADVDMVDSHGLKPFAYVDTLHPGSAASTSRIQMFQQLLPSSELDEENKIEVLTLFESRESWLHIQKQIWPDYYQPSNAGARLKVVGGMIWRTSRERAPESIKLALFGDDIPASCGLNSLEAFETRILSNILSHLASKFGSLRARPNEIRANKNLKDIDVLQNLVRDIIITYGIYHRHSHLIGPRQGGLKETQLIALVQGFFYSSVKTSAINVFWSKVWVEAMLPWLEFLEVCGIDLVEYGKYQKIELRQDKVGSFYVQGDLTLYHPDRLVKAHLTNFKYGPSPLDWHFWWSEPTDLFAGQFWHLVERSLCEEPKFWMPGAWVV